MEEPSIAERITGSAITKGAATLLAATTPYAPIAAVFIPLLCETFAYGRYQKRIEETINEIQADLAEQRTKVGHITDAQYKFINEIISTVLQTLEGEKLSYLRCAVRACVNAPDMTHKEASVISRIIRDISVDEIRLLANNFHIGGLEVSDGCEVKKEDQLYQRTVLQNTPENIMLMSGLLSLGLLVLDDSVFSTSYPKSGSYPAPKANN